ncbi:hypothetical protein F7R01_05295 [Pseudomonas argentinensis]|uniref:TonB C-terminal domain-containing protein n=1 Tax=Phytopseudomonas argentinensis TaxID=289370 RepID=A0A1I3KF54_9GAMM|nr:hypothetical protein [Pseudomonas argentinensis]KAB0550631.1 hypothetical protein F7R01_05295 [Pseudomonas argentinensis]SFI71087.1 hypothetical protein SAMN05216602_2467 [Pseudomonas argentinensis]
MLKPRLIMLTGCLALVACSTPAPPAAPKTSDELAQEHFTRLAMQALYGVGRRANPAWRQASLEVRFIIDRQNQVIDCQARPVSKSKLSDGLPFNPQVAERMNRLCWQTVLPPMPSKLMDEGPTTELIAPLLFPEQASDPQSHAREAAQYARNDYFWQQLFANRTLDSIGRARLIGILDAQHNVSACQVIIEPHPMRRREFKQDNDLLEHLGQACSRLDDVPLIPGQPVNAQGQYVFSVTLDYSPWRAKALLSGS